MIEFVPQTWRRSGAVILVLAPEHELQLPVPRRLRGVEFLLDGLVLTLELSLVTMSSGWSSASPARRARLRAAWARGRSRLCGGDPQHAAARPALHRLLRPAQRRGEARRDTAAMIALSINLGAYSIEIVRAGLQAIPRSQIEAGHSLGLSRLPGLPLRHDLPALKMMFPALASQFILLMLATSVVSQISAQELFHTASIMQSRTFRDFEVYTVIAASIWRSRSSSACLRRHLPAGVRPHDDPRIRLHRRALPDRRHPLDLGADGGRLHRRRRSSASRRAPARLALAAAALDRHDLCARRCRARRCSPGCSCSSSGCRSSASRSRPGSRRRRPLDLWRRLPRRDLARLPAGDSQDPVGGRRLARPVDDRAAALHHRAAGAADRDPADGRLPGAAHQEHLARRRRSASSSSPARGRSRPRRPSSPSPSISPSPCSISCSASR